MSAWRMRCFARLDNTAAAYWRLAETLPPVIPSATAVARLNTRSGVARAMR